MTFDGIYLAEFGLFLDKFRLKLQKKQVNKYFDL